MDTPIKTFVLALVVGWLPASLPASDLHFARDVLPILSDKCFVCHGPDAEDGLVRLDSFAAASEDLGGYRAIDPEQPTESELLTRILSSDSPMPPEDAEKQLSETERQILIEWVESGGTYSQHWAFETPRTREDHDGSSSRQLDAFIRAPLLDRNVDFAPQADPAILARRAALVLTGLPPEPDQLRRFLSDVSGSDVSGNAYERLVDELLDSPRFGEHQARYWLDAVRYGDTHGLHLDNRRGIYPYRDWVVRAFNENLPLDQFILWQLAGDLLPNPTIEQKVATGFVRLNPSTGEGGAISEEFQAKNNFDRVETFGTVFLGLSLTCARCHNHKYDPITQREYYQLMAFFNSTAEPALDGNSYTYGPTVKSPRNQQQWHDWSENERECDQLFRSIRSNDSQQSRWIEYANQQSQWKVAAWSHASTETQHGKSSEPAEEVTAEAGIELDTGASSDDTANASEAKNPTVLRSSIELPQRHCFWVSIKTPAETKLWVDDQLVWKQAEGKDTPDIFPITLDAGTHSLQLRVSGDHERDKISIELTSPWDSLRRAGRWKATPIIDRLWMIASATGPFADSPFADNAKQLALDRQRLQADFTTSLIAKELDAPRQTFVLRRGEYNLPIGESLRPGVIEVLNEFPSDVQASRLGLAQWLTDHENPLVARVWVNRLWQQVFGEGLVRTPEDFGLQGEQPSHPELLDWLAIEMHRSDWDFKHLMRLLVTSRTFRQSSAWRDDFDDPNNRWYGRGPSYRLDAEVIRDLGLWSSDLLDPTMGGEGVKPYQPSGMWKALAHPASNTKHYKPDQDKRLYRRSLYVYWKRTSPHPMMTLFDAPDRESSCVRRNRTNTALQSLAMLNETQRVEMARAAAVRIVSESDDDNERLNRFFTLVTSRLPSAQQRETCQRLLRDSRLRYENDPQQAIKLIEVGDSAAPDDCDPVEIAAWTQVVSVILASDLAIMLY